MVQQDGSAALPPVEILPPDDWEWVSDWKIDGSGGRDTGGWEYTKEIGKFDASRGENDRSPVCVPSKSATTVYT